MKKLFYCLILFLVGCSVNGLNDYNKGVEFQQSNQIGLAEQQFKIAIQNNPDLAEAYLNLGKIFMDKGWLDGAETNTKKAIELLSQKQETLIKGSTWKEAAAIAYNNLGVIGLRRAIEAETRLNAPEVKSQLQLARGNFQKALELDPNNPEANSNVSKVKNINIE